MCLYVSFILDCSIVLLLLEYCILCEALRTYMDMRHTNTILIRLIDWYACTGMLVAGTGKWRYCIVDAESFLEFPIWMNILIAGRKRE